jgi:hypothetical protein
MCVGRDVFVGVFERYMDERTKCNDLKTISKKIVSQSGKSAHTSCGPPGPDELTSSLALSVIFSFVSEFFEYG